MVWSGAIAIVPLLQALRWIQTVGADFVRDAFFLLSGFVFLRRFGVC